MFIEPTITWVPLGFSGYIWLDTKIVYKNTGFKNGACVFVLLLVQELRVGGDCKYNSSKF